MVFDQRRGEAEVAIADEQDLVFRGEGDGRLGVALLLLLMLWRGVLLLLWLCGAVGVEMVVVLCGFVVVEARALRQLPLLPHGCGDGDGDGGGGGGAAVSPAHD